MLILESMEFPRDGDGEASDMVMLVQWSAPEIYGGVGWFLGDAQVDFYSEIVPLLFS